MKVIVAGAHGSVGQRVVLRALQSSSQHTVLGIDSSSNPAPPYLQDHIPDAFNPESYGRYKFVQLDLRDFVEVMGVLKDWIGGEDGNNIGLVNLAAIRNPGDGLVMSHNT